MNPLLHRDEKVKPNTKVEFEPRLPFDEVWREYYTFCNENGLLVPQNPQSDGDVETIVAIPSPEIMVTATEGYFVTNRQTNRQKFYLSAPNTKAVGTLANRFMVVTETGNDPKKEKAGHSWVDTSKRWISEASSQKIALLSEKILSGQVDEDLLHIIEEEKGRQKFRRYRAEITENGVAAYYEVNKILEGPGHGRIWTTYYPGNVELDMISATDDRKFRHNYSLDLGLGLTIVQGDTSDERGSTRSPAGSTHVTLGHEGIRPNYVEYLGN